MFIIKSNGKHDEMCPVQQREDGERRYHSGGSGVSNTCQTTDVSPVQGRRIIPNSSFIELDRICSKIRSNGNFFLICYPDSSTNRSSIIFFF